MSKVTVLMPVYNNQEDVLDAINSIINQTYKNWELIIIDDNSTDKTYQIIKEYIKNKNNIFLIKNDVNRGTYVSINEGLKKATGDYVTKIGSDDKFAPTKLEEQVYILANRKHIVCVSTMYSRDNLPGKQGHSTIMYRRSIVNNIGYYDSVRFGADSEFYERIIKVYKITAVKKLPKVLYFAKIRKNSLTTSNATGLFNCPGEDIRLRYLSQFRIWHNKTPKPYMEYPLTTRPFAVDPIMI